MEGVEASDRELGDPSMSNRRELGGGESKTPPSPLVMLVLLLRLPAKVVPKSVPALRATSTSSARSATLSSCSA